MTCKECPCPTCRLKYACWTKKKCTHTPTLCVVIYDKHEKDQDKSYASVMQANHMREASRIMGGASINLNHKDYAVRTTYIKPCKIEYLNCLIKERKQ